MLKVNRKTEYALMALKFMATKEQGVKTSAREICDNQHIPFDTTSKVMQLLNSAGWLSSTKGIKGGYALTINLAERSFKDLENIVEKDNMGSPCASEKGLCDLIDTCNIKNPLQNLNNNLNNFLSRLTLEELLLNQSYNREK